MRGMQLVALPKETLPDMWPNVVRFVEKIAARFPDEWSVPVIAAACANQQMLLWLIWDEANKRPLGCIGTKFGIRASKKKVLDISWVAGDDRNEWSALISVLEDYAKQNGCDQVEFVGRLGWAKSFPDYRMEKQALFVKELN